MYLQGVDNVYDLKWNDDVKYGHVHHQQEVEQSTYNFEKADVDMLLDFFNKYEAESSRMIKEKLVLPAYEYVYHSVIANPCFGTHLPDEPENSKHQNTNLK